MKKYNQELINNLEKIYNEMDSKHLGIAYNEKGLLYAYRLNCNNRKEFLQTFYTNSDIEKFIKEHKEHKKDINSFNTELEKEMEL